MGRPKQDEPRIHQLNIALTDCEHELLQRRAAAAALRPVDFARSQLFSAGRQSAEEDAPPPLDPLLLNQLSRLGNLLNQIARRMHSFGQPAPASLESLLAQIRRLISGVGRGS